MDDNGRENQSLNVDANDNTDNDLLAQKTDHLLSLSLANCVPNGQYKRPRLSFSQASQHPSGRAVLEPIPLAKLSRSRRLSNEGIIQLAENCSKGNSEERPSSSDELLTKMFNNSCMEALDLLKKAYGENLVSVVIIPISFPLISLKMAIIKKNPVIQYKVIFIFQNLFCSARPARKIHSVARVTLIFKSVNFEVKFKLREHSVI